MLEKDIVNAIKKALTKRGAVVTKTHGSPHLAGVADLLVCYEGRYIAIEVKRPDTRGTLTPRQAAFLKSISDAGGIAGVATSVDEALALLGDVGL